MTRMRSSRVRAAIAVAVLAGVALVLPAAAGAVSSSITEYKLTAGSGPGDMTVGSDGNTWFVDQGSGRVGYITHSGKVKTFALPKGSAPNSITSAPSGNVWVTETGTSELARITPTTGVIAQYKLAANTGPRGITTGPDGNIWFTEFTANRIGRIIPSTGKIATYPISTANSGPARITAGRDGNMWFTEATANRIGRVTTAGTGYTSFAAGGSTPARITTGPDGDIWYSLQGSNKIAQMTLTGTVHTFTVPTPGSQPTGIAASPGSGGAANYVYFTEQGTAQIGRFNLSTQQFNEYTLTAKSKPTGMVEGSDGNVWFSENAVSKIGVKQQAQGKTEYVVEHDNWFGPSTRMLTLGSGESVAWLFMGPSSSGVLDATHLIQSGAQAMSSAYTAGPFDFAGNFDYHSTSFPAATGTIKVAPTGPATAAHSTSYTITMASAAVPGGDSFDIQWEQPGTTSYSSLANGVSTGTYTFTLPATAGTYRFQVRFNTASGTSGWSSVLRVAVT